MEQTSGRKWIAQGARLRQARLAAGLSQAAVAEAAAVAEKTVSKWENGWQNPHANQLARVTPSLGVTEEWIRFGTGAGPGEAGDVTGGRLTDTRETVQRPLPRVARSHAVRVWLKEFELELTRAGVPDERIAEAIDLVTAPQVFTYFAGGSAGVREFTEEEALKGMRTLADVVRATLRERGFKIGAAS